jgi:transposase
MRTAFTPEEEGKWRLNKSLLAFANHYGFVPRRCRIRRSQTKGKGERTIGYLTVNIWPQVKDHAWEISALNEAVEK